MTDSSPGRFVGRSTEQAVLVDALGAASTGQPWIVLVEGPAGMGKTALLRRSLRDAGDATVVWAGGDQAESVLELGLARQLLDRMGMPSTAGSDPFSVGAALLAGLGALEERGPVVLVVDDLHWADDGSVRALLFCLRRLRADPVTVLLASRPRTLERFGEGWVRFLADDGRTRRIDLAGLSTAEVEQLATAAGYELARESAARLQEHTGGNPLYLAAMLEELSDQALSGAISHFPAPRAYAVAVLSRLARLSPEARELVCASAVLGVRAPLRVASSVAGLSAGAAALDEVVRAGLLALGPSQDELIFAHPLVRAAVYEDMAPSKRRRLHRAVAPLLPEPIAFAQRVSAASGEFDDGLAADLVMAAAAAEDAGSLTAAARYLGWAHEVDGDRERAERSVCDAVRLLMGAGDLQGVRDRVSAVLACRDSPVRRFTLALVAGGEGDLTRAAAEVSTAAEAVSGDDTLFGHCCAWLAVVHSMLGDDSEAITWARRAQTVSVPAATAMAVQVLACGFARGGRFDEAFALLDGCSPRRPDPRSIDAELLAIRGVVRNWAGDYSGAIDDLRVVLAWQREGVAILGITEAYAALAEAEFRSGDWPAAALHIDLGLSLAADRDQPWHLAYAHAVATQVCAARGDHAGATEHCAAAAVAVDAFPSAEARGYLTLARAHAAWARADWPGVGEALAPLVDPADGALRDHPNLALWRYLLAEACVAVGRGAEARRLRDQVPDPPWGGTSDADRSRLDAQLCLAGNDVDGAARVYAEAMPDPGSRRLADGLLALDYGRLLVDAHQRRSAVGVLHTARTILSGLGADGLAADTDRLLRACGVGTARLLSSTTRVDLLTPRELTVARLVVSGMTNREVAAELYLSVKAVEYHLAGVFAKLGIHSRRQLPADLTTGGAP